MCKSLRRSLEEILPKSNEPPLDNVGLQALGVMMPLTVRSVLLAACTMGVVASNRVAVQTGINAFISTIFLQVMSGTRG